MAVAVERREGIAVVTVERPDALNALDVEHLRALHARLAEVADDDSARVVVLTGAGERAFIAGADIKYMQGLSVLEAREWAGLGHAAALLLETMRKPTIAAINGYALGGGCELALACDLRFASRTAKLGQPEINLGILPGWGGSQRLARATSLGFAKELILTGRNVDADEAERRGLVNAVYEPHELMAKTLEVATSLAEKSPIALWYAKEATNLALQGGHEPNLTQESNLFAMAFSTDDQKEGMAAFVEKRKAAFRGR
ncbi:MAG: enoyl-CoA hydratase/isomerase family protein [Actinobacteria bacterium]|nr:enoyl-CoA hydratase/isomerase family protein [Actinomycetota bacterium]